MEEVFEGEEEYYNQDGILITNARVKIGDTTYATSCLSIVTQDSEPPNRKREFLFFIVTVIFLFLLLQSLVIGKPNLLWLIGLVVFGLWCAKKYYGNEYKHTITVILASEGELKLDFTNKLDVGAKVFRALNQAVTYGNRAATLTETRMERYHSGGEKKQSG
ncbi:DUF6232 family protein [Microbacteriaceae bacterium 4G12]